VAEVTGELSLCAIWSDDVNQVIPTEQADFGDIRPMAVRFPMGVSTIGATRFVRFVTLRELMFETWVSPNGFTFVAQDRAGQSTSVLADAHSAQAIPADRAFLYVNQKWFWHQDFGWIAEVLLDRKSGDQVAVAKYDSHPLEFGIFASSPFGSPKVSDGLVEGGFENRRSVVVSDLRSLRVTFCPFVGIVDGDEERRHIAVEHPVTSWAIRLVSQVFCDMIKPVAFFASGCIDQTGGGFVAIASDRFKDSVFCVGCRWFGRRSFVG